MLSVINIICKFLFAMKQNTFKGYSDGGVNIFVWPVQYVPDVKDLESIQPKPAYFQFIKIYFYNFKHLYVYYLSI